jgi:hypothetical protein
VAGEVLGIHETSKYKTFLCPEVMDEVKALPPPKKRVVLNMLCRQPNSQFSTSFIYFILFLLRHVSASCHFQGGILQFYYIKHLGCAIHATLETFL